MQKTKFEIDDLYEMYDWLNVNLFNDELNPILIKWIPTKNILAQVYYDKKKIGNLSVSSFYYFSKDQMLAIMAHEMVHVYLMQIKNDFEELHGKNFKRIIKRINDSNILKCKVGVSFNFGNIIKPQHIKNYHIVVLTNIKGKDISYTSVHSHAKGFDEFLLFIKNSGRYSKLTKYSTDEGLFLCFPMIVKRKYKNDMMFHFTNSTIRKKISRMQCIETWDLI